MPIPSIIVPLQSPPPKSSKNLCYNSDLDEGGRLSSRNAAAGQLGGGGGEPGERNRTCNESLFEPSLTWIIEQDLLIFKVKLYIGDIQ